MVGAPSFGLSALTHKHPSSVLVAQLTEYLYGSQRHCFSFVYVCARAYVCVCGVLVVFVFVACMRACVSE